MKLVDPVKLEKMMLAKRVGQFLANDQSEDERQAVEDVARVLSEDVSEQVREVLAFELRLCADLPTELAARIARDVEEVSSPFLATTKTFSDESLAKLVPDLKEFGRVALARRSDLGSLAAGAIVEHGESQSVTSLVRNDNLDIRAAVLSRLVDRFGADKMVMDQLSGRPNLPAEVVESLVDKVSSHVRQNLVQHYLIEAPEDGEEAGAAGFNDVWEKVASATPQQVHAYVTDLRGRRKLNMVMVMDMAERGCPAFLESAVALEAGLPLARVREIFDLSKPSDFVRLMQMSSVSKAMAPKVLKFVKSHYGQS